MRTVGVEEELLLVDASTGVPRSVADAMLGEHSTGEPSGGRSDTGESDSVGGTIDSELQQQMIETDTQPVEQLSDLGPQIRHWRRLADQLARESGARAVAIATSPLNVSPEVTVKPRYEAMVEQFGLTTLEQLTCGCHVHVSVESNEEGVGVLDRIRVWLPTLLALSANSPFWQGDDSGYASYRYQVWHRFPTAGPTDLFGSAGAYSGLVDTLLGTGVPLDVGMIYFDARLSAHFPTVEVRVADVCLDADDTILVAALARALVETAAREWQSGKEAPRVTTSLIHLASWRAARSALDGDLLDPVSGKRRPARAVVSALLDHVEPALADSGDRPFVDDALSRLLDRGAGAVTQRALFGQSRDLHHVVLEAADRTLR